MTFVQCYERTESSMPSPLLDWGSGCEESFAENPGRAFDGDSKQSEECASHRGEMLKCKM